MFNSYIQIHTHARVHTHTQLWHLPFECLWWLSYWMRNRLSVSHPITSNNKLNFVIREGLPRWLHGKESACNVKDVGSIPGLERSPEVGNDNPLQYSRLGNPMDRGACGGWGGVIVHGVMDAHVCLKEILQPDQDRNDCSGWHLNAPSWETLSLRSTQLDGI